MRIVYPKKPVKLADIEATSIVPQQVFNNLFNNFYWLKYRTNLIKLKDDIGTDIVNKQGKLFKRIQKYIKASWKAYGNAGMTSNYVDQLLEGFRVHTLDRYIHPGGTVTFTFTDKFDWAEGDYGDNGSCFFTARTHKMLLNKRRTLISNDAKAILFHMGEKGIARGLILPASLIGAKNGKILTNCYGKTTEEVSKILSEFWDCPKVLLDYLDVGNKGPNFYFNRAPYYLGTDKDIYEGYSMDTIQMKSYSKPRAKVKKKELVALPA